MRAMGRRSGDRVIVLGCVQVLGFYIPVARFTSFKHWSTGVVVETCFLICGLVYIQLERLQNMIFLHH